MTTNHAMEQILGLRCLILLILCSLNPKKAPNGSTSTISLSGLDANLLHAIRILRRKTRVKKEVSNNNPNKNKNNLSLQSKKRRNQLPRRNLRKLRIRNLKPQQVMRARKQKEKRAQKVNSTTIQTKKKRNLRNRLKRWL